VPPAGRLRASSDSSAGRWAAERQPRRWPTPPPLPLEIPVSKYKKNKVKKEIKEIPGMEIKQKMLKTLLTFFDHICFLTSR
jgi:hypothetical protein